LSCGVLKQYSLNNHFSINTKQLKSILVLTLFPVKNARKKKLEDYLIYEEDFLHLEEPVFAVPY
jgi:hypothetical protein